MTVLYISLLLAACLLALAWLLHAKMRPTTQYSPEYMQALSEAIYQIGYDDQKAGRPQKSWEWDGAGKLHQSGQQMLAAFKSLYEHGWQNARDGKPSIAQEISDNRKMQLITLQDMRNIVEDFRAGMTRVGFRTL